MQEVSNSNGQIGILASAATIASPFQKQVSEAIQRRQIDGKSKPKLVGILAKPSPPSIAYAQWTKKACEQVGIQFEVWQTWSDEKDRQDGDVEMQIDRKLDTDLEADVEDLIIAANADDSIHGIMVYYPIFGGRQDTYLQQIVDPRKDVEGLHFSYCFNMYHNIRWISPSQLGGAPGTTFETAAGSADSEEGILPGFAKSILPCTPLAVVKGLETLEVYDGTLPYGDRLFGKTITVVNRSEVVGRPLAALLSNDGARVYSIDVESVQEFNKRAEQDADRKPSKTVMLARQRNASHRLRPSHIVRPCSKSIKDCIAESDVVISGVPSADFKIQTEWIKNGAITVNFSSEKNFDTDVRSRAAKHLPAIGKMTIAMLQRNLLRLVEYREMLAESGNANDSSGNRNGIDGNGTNGASQNSSDESKNNLGKSSSNGHSNVNDTSTNTSYSASTGGAAVDQDGFAVPPTFSHGQMTSIKEKESDNPDETRRPHTAGTASSPNGSSKNIVPFQRGRGGQANRERANTLHATRPDMSRERPQVMYMTPPVQLRRMTGAPQGEWEWRSPGTVRSEISHSQTPPLNQIRGHQNSSQSPLLFAPIAGATPQQAYAYAQNARHAQQGGSNLASAASPRSATPVSPLVIDGLSVEDHGTQSQRMSWDSIPPRTPRDANDTPLPSERMPSVLGRPHAGYAGSPADEKMALDHHQGMAVNVSQHGAFSRPMINQQAPAQQMSRSGSFNQDRIAHSRRRRRPPFSYSSLIAQAIASSPEGRMTLREIYTWISNAYPDLYNMDGNEGSGWQNTVRHNLSLNKAFIKVARTAQDIYDSCSSGLPNLSQQARGKGGWWMLDPNVNPATIGSGMKSDYGEEEYDGTRMSRRRRTNSMSASVASEDSSNEMNSPYGMLPTALHPNNDLPPSVLQQRGRAFTSSAAQGVGSPFVPSVFRAAQQQTSMERSNSRGAQVVMESPAQQFNSTRPRGYTTSAAEHSIRGDIPSPRYAAFPPPHPSHHSRMSPAMQVRQIQSPHYIGSPGYRAEVGSTTPMTSSNLALPSFNSPNKRKLRFDGENGAQLQNEDTQSPRPLLDSLAQVASTVPRSVPLKTEEQRTLRTTAVEGDDESGSRMSITGLLR